MALRDEILATTQRITLDVIIAGKRVNDVLDVTVSMGYDQINAQAAVVCATRPSQAIEQATVEIWAGYNGYTAQIFSGELSGVSWDHFPTGIALDCRDLFARTRYSWGAAARTYTSQDDAAIIQNLVEAYGIPPSKTSIESSAWTLGVVQDVVLDTGRDAAALISEIDDLAGYKTATTSDGVVRRRRVSGNPAATAFWTFTKGVDLLQSRRIRTSDGIVNRAIIDGLEYEGVAVSGTATATNQYLPDPPGTVVYQTQSNLVETDSVAGTIASRIVSDRNRRPERLELTVIGNPLIQPFMTIGMNHTDLEATAALVFVQHVEHRITASSFTTTLITSGGNLSGYDTTAANTNPIAIFDLKLFQEGQDTGGGTVSPFYVGIADGAQSYDPDGSAAVSYAWSGTAPGGTVTAFGGTTGAQYRFQVSGTPSTIQVQLIVTDAGGAKGTTTLSGTVASTPIYVEDLYTAEGTVVAVSVDGQQTWRTATLPAGTATCLAPFAPAWGQAWGAGNGVVYRTEDNLANGTVINSGTPHATAVTAVWIHELEQDRIWAGAASGRIAYSGNRGTTWTLRGTAAGQVNEIRESYSSLDTVYVTAGDKYQVSFDGGRTFTTLGTATGGTAWRMASGWSTNWWSNLGAPGYIRNESGGSVAFSAGTPTGVRGISPGWRTPELYAAGDQGSAILYRTDSTFGTATPQGTATTQVNHIIRSGNEDGIVYLAGNNGLYKSVRMDGAPIRLRDTGSRVVHMAGYGAAHLPIAPAKLLIPTNGIASGGVYVYDPKNRSWSLKNSGLPTGAIYWRCVSANPFDPNEWLVLGSTLSSGVCDISSGKVVIPGTSSSPLWHTSNAGASWTEVVLTSSYSGTNTNATTLKTVEWDDTRADRWLLPAVNTGGGVADDKLNWWWGTNASAGSVLSNASNTGSYTPAFVGQNGDWVVIPSFNNGNMRYIANGSSSYTTPTGTTPTQRPDDGTPVDRGPLTSRAVVMLIGGGSHKVWATSDYTASQPTQKYNTGNPVDDVRFSWATDGLYLTGSIDGSIVRIADPTTDTTATVVVNDGITWGHIRADRWTRRAIATIARGTDIKIKVYDGSVWATITGPSITPSNASNWVEIIVR